MSVITLVKRQVSLLVGTLFATTSASSVAIGTGSKSFTIGTGKGFAVGQFVTVTDQASAVNYMVGNVTAYVAGVLTVNVTATGGSGTKTAWRIAVSGVPGVAGATGGIAGGTLTGHLGLRVALTNLTAAATTDIGASDSNRIHIAGAAVITSFGTGVNQFKFIRFLSTGSTLTHDATTLVLPGAANIVTAAGDNAIALSDATGNWRVVQYTRANGKAVVSSALSELTDYEVGTFVPAYKGTTTDPTVTYTRQDGRYVRFGGMLYFNIHIETSAATGGGGTVRIVMPFSTSSAFLTGYTAAQGCAAYTGWTTPPQGWYMVRSSAEMRLIKSPLITNLLLATDLSATTNTLVISGCYPIV